MLFATLLLATAAAAEGRPLFYWGARPPVIAVEDAGSGGPDARVLEVHAAREGPSLIVRFTFDRRVLDSLRLPDGTPVSGRLKAVLYFDGDDDRKTGLAQGDSDLRSGCERRLEIGVVAMGADEEEKRGASAVIAATLYSLSSEGRRRTLWRADDEQAPLVVSAHGEWLEIRLPLEALGLSASPRLVLAAGDMLAAGRMSAPVEPAPVPRAATGSFELRPGESHRVAEDGLSIVFQEVLTDSRCPKGQVCVWAGDATVRLVVGRGNDVSRTVDVALSAKTATTLEGELAVRLVDLLPTPAAGGDVPPDAYRARLQLVHGIDTPLDVQ